MRTSSLHRSVARALGEAGIPAQGPVTLVLGLSGGPDSVALADVLAALASRGELKVIAAHFDHGLRPGSGEDRVFCERLCSALGIPIELGEGDVHRVARADGSGIEQAARKERYAFLRSVAQRTGAAAVGVAHTRDDQVETLLLHLLRGSGRRGLGGMTLFRAGILRPMLGCSRADVMRHLRQHGLEWREDPTNRDLSFARNRVRHELLPYLEARFNPRLRDRLAELAEIVTDEEALLEGLAAQPALNAIKPEGRGTSIDVAALRGVPLALARRVVRRAVDDAGGLAGVQARHVDSVLRLARRPHPSGRRAPLPGKREARVRFDRIHIATRPAARSHFALPLPVPGRVTTPSGHTFAARPWHSGTAPEAGTIVARALTEMLVVRTRRPGDRVLRGGREVSLRRFLMDQRVPFDERDALPVVATGRRVLWIPGLPSERGPQPDLVHLAVQQARNEVRP